MKRVLKIRWCLLLVFPGFAFSENPKPLGQVIGSGGERGGVMGGWPPQRIGEGDGGVLQENFLAEGELILSDENFKKMKTAVITEIETAGEAEEGGDKKVVLPQAGPVDGAKEEAGNVEAVEAVSSLLGKEDDSKGKLLPPLPAPEDRITPARMTTRRSPVPNLARKRSHRDRPVYRVGPCDQITFSSFDRTDLNRTVTIAPDGTVSYLQAVAVNVKNLTVDEMKAKIEKELQKYLVDFKLIVTPQTLQSQEFAVLGRVKRPGTYPLDRPITILEGIARAQGVEIGTIRGSAFGLADFEHSFVSRGGRKLDVNLSRLYSEGDLSQNVQLQPNDYLYIASILKSQYYVLGAVNSPGRIKMPNKLTVTKAVSLAGGFREDAYKMKVIVVRGCIHRPEVHVVNVRDVLRGAALDIMVDNRDIIFVARRPFRFAEEMLDTALNIYVQTLTAEGFNQNYTPLTL